MEAKCKQHDAPITAYCRKHRSLLCTKCVIYNTHQKDYGDGACDICAIDEITDEERLYLETTSVRLKVRDKMESIRNTDLDLTDLEEKIKGEIIDCFDGHVQDLEQKKSKTIVMLKEGIDNRRQRLSQKHAELERIMGSISACEARLDKTEDACDGGKNLNDMWTEINRLQGQSDKTFTMASVKLKAFFDPLSVDTNKLEPQGILGSITFSDEIYEEVWPIKTYPMNQESKPDEEVSGSRTGNRPISDRNKKQSDARKSRSLSMSLRNPIYEISSRAQQSANRKSTGALQNPPVDVTTIEVRCSAASTKSPCIVQKIECIADKRFAIFDSGNNRIILVDEKGHIMNTSEDNENDGVILGMCLFKTDRLALLCKRSDGECYIGIEEVGRHVVKDKQRINLTPGTVTDDDILFTGFEVDSSYKYMTFFLTYPDRVLKIQRGKVIGFLRRDSVDMKNLQNAETLFDFQGEILYTLDHDGKRLECYEFTTGTVKWTMDHSSTLFMYEFVPITMRYRGTRSLVLLCSDRLLVISKQDGSVNVMKMIDFGDDIDALCVKGKGVVVVKRQSGEEACCISMVEYANTLK